MRAPEISYEDDMPQINRDRLISIVLLLAALVFAAWLPADYSFERFVLVGIIGLAAVIWLLMKRG